MSRFFACVAGWSLVWNLGGVRSVIAQTPPPVREVQCNGHEFTLRDGFAIELVAAPPLVDRPITAAFDEAGRLYVSDSSGSNDKVDKQLAERPHRIVRLEDSDGDGRFDKSIVFADQMMFPEGTMWLAGSLYVTAPPSIWKLTDRDGDGVADEREEWFSGKTLTGCANDLHGPYLGPDGWVYWAKGAFARQTYERAGKSLRVIADAPLNILGKEVGVTAPRKPSSDPSAPAVSDQTNGPPTWSTRASHIFRCRPDGSGLEVVMTGGMDNPVDVVFTPNGERIFSTTFFQHPAAGRRDGLIHAVYGGIYGKDHDPIHERQHKWTGPLMPPLSHLGAAAPCGLEVYRSRVFGAEYYGNLFTCLFNMHKITRHVLEPAGATFRSHDEDFLVSNNIDFHPTDILEDADGSLLVVDTGGWYKLCCPTSQLHKPDVLGAIYRVRRVDSGQTVQGDPRGRDIDWSRRAIDQLVSRDLADQRPALRDRAIDEIVRRGEEAIQALSVAIRESPRAEHRRDVIWALSRIDHSAARATIRFALSDSDETVRQVALHAISLWRDDAAIAQLEQLVRHGTPQNARVAAEALGRIGRRTSVPAVLDAAQRVAMDRSNADALPPLPNEHGTQPDRFLMHSLTYAMIEIADPEATSRGLGATDLHTRRAALIALDQMEGGGLDPKTVVQLLSGPDGVMKETASWIVSRHAEWGDAVAEYLRRRLESTERVDAAAIELARQIGTFAKNSSIQTLLAEVVSLRQSRESSNNNVYIPVPARRVALRAMRESALRELPKPWVATLKELLSDADVELVRDTVAVIRAIPAPKDSIAEIAGALLKLADSKSTPTDMRLAALAAVPGRIAAIEPEVFDFLRAHLDPNQPVVERAAAADVLSRANLTSPQLEALAESFKTVGPMELDRLLAAYEHSSDPVVGQKLVASLKQSPALAALRAESIQRSIAKCGPQVQEQARELFAVINVDVERQKERLEELLTSIKDGGDIRRGQAVFMSQKAACASCHQFGYLGGNIGPDLTRIGGVRSERDLLESIAFPSASFVRSYESVTVATREGKITSGVLKKDAPDEIVLALNATEVTRIAREEIDEIRPGAVSVMPSGLDQQLTRQELADLVAFLKAAK